MPPKITCRCASNAMFRINCVVPSSPDYSVELSPFSRRPRSLRLLICSPLHNQPPYATLGSVATSILILIVARFSSCRLDRVASAHTSGTVVARSSAVTLDPHHEAILDALNRKLDPDAFEECAADLLRRDWPTLVLVRGGADDGFDGAVADATDEPFPLVTTTGEKLVPNLARNLDRAKRKGWHSKKALFATSRRITGTTRNRLSQAARERGVTLIQAYDQDWFAQRLYREPQWCWRLLRVTGRPAALSLFPVSRRPMLGKVVLGRDEDVGWLLEQNGDCLLVGEPGSGKTFLLWSLAQRGLVRFLVDHDRATIANDIRSLRPPSVVVDDAHIDPSQIATLDQIRREIGADFRIIVTSWPSAADEVRSALKVGRMAERTLDRLNANTIVDIIKSIGGSWSGLAALRYS